MMRAMLTLTCVFVVAALPAVAQAASCSGCKAVREKGEGFCCGKGIAFGVDLTSQKLYEALAGKKVNPDEMKCPGCRSAAEANGVCKHCKTGVVEGKVYQSVVAYALAKGKPVSHKEVAGCGGCIGCETAHADNGLCPYCKVGFVGGRMFGTEEDYQAALAAHKTLVEAAKIAKQCETCAVAMVTDGKCSACGIGFTGGKKSE
jgi:hypothetical protein